MKSKKLLFMLFAVLFLAITLHAETPPRKLIYAAPDRATVSNMLCMPLMWGDSTYVDHAKDSVVYKDGNMKTNWVKMGLSAVDTVGWLQNASTNGISVGDISIPDSVLQKVNGLVWDTARASQTVNIWNGTDSVPTYVDTLYIREIHWTNLGLAGIFKAYYPMEHLKKIYIDNNRFFRLEMIGTNTAGPKQDQARPTAPLLEELVANNNNLGPDKYINTSVGSPNYGTFSSNPDGFLLLYTQPNLRVLKLQNNNLHTKINNVNNLPALEYLDISNNRLMNVSLANNPKLKIAKLSGNSFQMVALDGSDALDTLLCDHNRFRFSTIPQKNIAYANFEVQDSVTFQFDNVFHFEKEYVTVRNGKTDTTQFVIYKQRRSGSLYYDLFSDTNYVNEGGKITILKNFESGLGYQCVVTNGNYPGVSICFKIATKSTVDYDYYSAQALRDFLSEVTPSGTYNYQNIGISDLNAQVWESNVGVLDGNGISWTSTPPRKVTSINFASKTLKGTLDCQYFTTLATLNLDGDPKNAASTEKYRLCQVKLINLNTGVDFELIMTWNMATDTLDFTNCPNVKNINIIESPQIRVLTGLSGKNKLEVVQCSKPLSIPPSIPLNTLKNLDVQRCVALKEINIRNNFVSTLDLRSNTNLREINVQNNIIPSLDLNLNTNLSLINVSQNAFTTINNLKLPTTPTSTSITLVLDKNAWDSLNLGNFPAAFISKLDTLSLIACGGMNESRFTGLQLVSNLKTLNIEGNAFKKLSLTGLNQLKNLICNGNQIDSLDLSTTGSSILDGIKCQNNKLTYLKLPANYTQAAAVLMCQNNQLKEIENISVYTGKFLVNAENNFNQSNNFFKFSTLMKNAKTLSKSNAYIYSPQGTITEAKTLAGTIDLSSELYITLADTNKFYDGAQIDTTKYLWVNINGSMRDTLPADFMTVASPGIFTFGNTYPLTGRLVCEMRNKVYPNLVLQYEVLDGDGQSATLTGKDDVCQKEMVTYRTESGKTHYRWTYKGGMLMGGGNGFDSIQLRWDTSGTQQVGVSYDNDGNSIFTKEANKSVTVKGFTKEPAGGDYAEKAKIELKSTATTGATYEWFLGNTKISDANSNNYTISSLSISTAGDYTVDAIYSNCRVKSVIVPIHIYPNITDKNGNKIETISTFYVLDSFMLNIKSTNTEVPLAFNIEKPSIISIRHVDTSYFGYPITPGSTMITVTQPASGVFAAAKPATPMLTVGKGNLVVVADNREKGVGTTLDLGTTAFTIEGKFKMGDAVTGVTLTSEGAAASAPKGNYDIIPSNAQGINLENYNINYIEGILTVTDPKNTKEGELHANVKVYPNPVTNGMLFIDLGTSGDYTIQLIDMTGRIVKEVKGSQSRLNLNVQDLKGLYTMKIQTANELAIKKIVVK